MREAHQSQLVPNALLPLCPCFGAWSWSQMTHTTDICHYLKYTHTHTHTEAVLLMCVSTHLWEDGRMLVWGCAVSTSSPLTASIIRLWAMSSRKCSYVSPGRSVARRSSASICGSFSTLCAVPSASTGRSCFPCSAARCECEDGDDGAGCCGMYTMGLHGVSLSNSMKTGSSIAHLQRVEHKNDPCDCDLSEPWLGFGEVLPQQGRQYVPDYVFLWAESGRRRLGCRIQVGGFRLLRI